MKSLAVWPGLIRFTLKKDFALASLTYQAFKSWEEQIVLSDLDWDTELEGKNMPNLITDVRSVWIAKSYL